MDSFEYVMVLVSIVIGLALTHVLTAIAAGVHRLRGHGNPLQVEAIYLLWIGYVVIWLVSFWWWEFKFQELQTEWSFGLYLFIVSYAIALFLLAAILVPSRLEGVTDSFEYFMAGRKWFFGANLVTIGLDTADTFLKGFEWGMRPVFLLQASVFVATSVVGIQSTNRSVQLLAALAAFIVQLAYMFSELDVLGAF